MKNIVVLTGAGMSAESGIKTFRDAGGLWEGHDVMEVASPIGWAKNPDLVLEFYNQRRKQLLEVQPNTGHKALVSLEKEYSVQIITQNVDDLHERAGSSQVLHLHGELLKVRSSCDDTYIMPWKAPLHLGDTCPKGCQLRPHIVWFGEAVPMLEKAIALTQKASIFIVIGTSLQVYPAAGLLHYIPTDSPIYLINPHPGISSTAFPKLQIIEQSAGEGVPKLVEMLTETLT